MLLFRTLSGHQLRPLRARLTRDGGTSLIRDAASGNALHMLAAAAPPASHSSPLIPGCGMAI